MQIASAFMGLIAKCNPVGGVKCHLMTGKTHILWEFFNHKKVSKDGTLVAK